MWASQMVLVVKNTPVNAGDKRDADSISGSGRSSGGGHAKLTPVFVPGESPWTEEPSRLDSSSVQLLS